MSRYEEYKLYVGNLPRDVRTSEVEDIFYKFGRIRNIDVRGYSTGSPYAFIEFEDSRDARDALRRRDGYDFDGHRLRVEYQKGRPRYRGRGDDDRHSNRGGPQPRRSNFRAHVSGLPPSGSWQDLKDHVRKVAEVVYANVFNDGTGVIEFHKESDLLEAVKELNDSRFKSHEGEVSKVFFKVQRDGNRKDSQSRSRSPSRSKSRSVSRSRSHSKSRSASRSVSMSRSRSRSPRCGVENLKGSPLSHNDEQELKSLDQSPVPTQE